MIATALNQDPGRGDRVEVEPGPSHRIDPALIAAVRAGDRAAAHALFLALKDRVFTLARWYMAGDTAAAEDLTQDVFIRVFTRLDQYRGDAGFSAWVRRILVNACLDEKRRRRRFDPLEPDLDQTLPDPAESAEARLERKRWLRTLHEAMARLTPPLRLTVLLKHVEGLSYAEIARQLDCSEGTVASRLNRAHRVLERRLRGWHARETGGDVR